MKKKKYLPLYEKWMETGNLPEWGLCNCFGKWLVIEEKWKYNDKLFPLFVEEMHRKDEFWAFEDDDDVSYVLEPAEIVGRQFSPLRQNIVLLMAAMNGEL